MLLSETVKIFQFRHIYLTREAITYTDRQQILSIPGSCTLHIFNLAIGHITIELDLIIILALYHFRFEFVLSFFLQSILAKPVL